MVVHNGWKLLGQGISYVAYLVNGAVVKVPRSYFANGPHRQSFQGGRWVNHTLEEADFQIPGDYRRDNALKEVKRQVRRALLYRDFAVPTTMDENGLVYQPFVAGAEPSDEQERMFKKVLKQHKMPTTDMFSGNFRITPNGYRVFDY